ncbi:MAG TPA: hypothetical protein VH186_22230 [Chloroflexia bacterium]|nr:hypothetical protein [Chloroflexia bacterium]
MTAKDDFPARAMGRVRRERGIAPGLKLRRSLPCRFCGAAGPPPAAGVRAARRRIAAPP